MPLIIKVRFLGCGSGRLAKLPDTHSLTTARQLGLSSERNYQGFMNTFSLKSRFPSRFLARFWTSLNKKSPSQQLLPFSPCSKEWDREKTHETCWLTAEISTVDYRKENGLAFPTTSRAPAGITKPHIECRKLSEVDGSSLPGSFGVRTPGKLIFRLMKENMFPFRTRKMDSKLLHSLVKYINSGALRENV